MTKERANLLHKVRCSLATIQPDALDIALRYESGAFETSLMLTLTWYGYPSCVCVGKCVVVVAGARANSRCQDLRMASKVMP